MRTSVARLLRVTSLGLAGVLAFGACGGGGSGPLVPDGPVAAPEVRPAPQEPEPSVSTEPAADTDEPDPELEEIEFDEPHRDPTAWQQVTANVGDGATVPKDVALQAFALTIGDVPGVE